MLAEFNLTGVAHSRVVDLDSNFMGLRGRDLDILNRELLPRLPCDRSL